MLINLERGRAHKWTAVILFTANSPSPRSVSLPKWICQKLGLRPYLEHRLRHFTHPSPNFYRGFKKCEIWPQFSIQVALQMPLFWIATTYLKHKTNAEALNADDLVNFCIVRPTHFWEPLSDYGSPYTITQPRIVGFCWNLVRRCIMGSQRPRKN